MKRILTFFLVLSALAGTALAQNTPNVAGKQWKPQNDEVYLQEISVKITTSSPVLSVAEAGGVCFALIDGKVNSVENETLKPESTAPSGVFSLKTENGIIWALSKGGLFRFQNSKWEKLDDRVYVDLCTHLGVLHAATIDEIFRLENGKFVTTKPVDGYYGSDITMIMEDGSQVLADPVELGPVTQIESYSGTLYVLRPGQLVLFDGKTVNQDFIDWGRLPSAKTTEMLTSGNRMYIGTDRGMAELRGATLKIIKGSDGLPVEETTCLTKGFDNDIWIGTTRGAVRMLPDDWHYFGASHWLPGEKVNDIAVGKNMVYVATENGLGIIKYEPYTLQKKAAYYERHLEEWGQKRLGFIHTIYQKNGEWIREVSDNDGGHTATYLAAMSYKYAATGDESARKEAVESFKAMLWLQKVTQTDGFLARSIWSVTGDKDERATQGSGGLPAKWYKTPDGKWYWKGDTSSDEVTAHFYAVSLFYDLVATGKDKEMAREHLNRMASYIIKCGWVMNDMDGKPTRWARWNPEYLLRPYGYNDRGINGLEILSFMETAYALTGDEKFKQGNQQLVGWGYHTNTLRQKNTFPPATLAPWDDNLAFESYVSLLRYCNNTALRSVYLRSLERTWEVKRMEHHPWYNFAYGALTGNDCELDKSVKHLREWTLDCVEYNYRNSHRDDLFIEAGYTSYEGAIKVLSPRETCVARGSGNATVLDGGANARRVMEPTSFLRDYWMGRYFGFINAPDTKDPKLTKVEPRTGQKFGAEPYNGPARPELY